MKSSDKPIILIGFKHVGKSTIGKALSSKLQRNYKDLDEQIESLFEQSFHKKLSCREIVQNHSQDFFRVLETQALRHVIDSSEPAVISLGGGTPLSPENQNLIASHIIVHITAPRAVVFERIRLSGRPAFFSLEEDPLSTFNRLWDEREKIYQKLTPCLVENNGSVEKAVNQIIAQCLGEKS